MSSTSARSRGGPTNGKVLAVASDFYSVGVPECVAAMAATGCIQLFDVRDPADSSITEQHYFLSLGSSSSSPKWAGKDDVLYSIDYQRGIDILLEGRALRPRRSGGGRPGRRPAGLPASAG